MDTVFIQGLKIDTVIGIYDWESKIRQEIVLDIEMSADISTAAGTDHIDQALNPFDESDSSLQRSIIHRESQSQHRLPA